MNFSLINFYEKRSSFCRILRVCVYDIILRFNRIGTLDRDTRKKAAALEAGIKIETEKNAFDEGLVKELEKTREKELRRYSEILASYSGARLTGSRDANELYCLHVRDSLYSVPLLPGTESGDGKGGRKKVIDVGSGGGLPGIVWAICRPDLSVTLLDSVRKKCAALTEMAAALHLQNVSVVWGRCEEHALTARGRENYAFASARALAHAGVVAEYLAPLVAQGGRLAAFKGPKGTEELKEVGPKWSRLGLSAPRHLLYTPGTETEARHYSLVVWEKKRPCPPGYPRKPGLALSKYWWR